MDMSNLQTLISMSNNLKAAEQASVKPIEPLKQSEAAVAEGPPSQPQQMNNNPLS